MMEYDPENAPTERGGFMYIDKNGDHWYRGNLHTHTTVSDGRKTPEETKAAYKAAGYDFLAITDHWKFGKNDENDPSGLCVLSGTEYNFGGEDTLNGVFHIVGAGMETDPMEVITRESTPQETIDEINRRGGISIFAHPAWSMNTWEMMASVNNYTMTEIYNSVSARPRNCRPYSGVVIDQLALRGRYPKLCATDDTHFWIGEQTRSFIYVNLHKNALCRENLIKAMRGGEFYATQGPRFSCRLEKTANGYDFVVECLPEDGVGCVTIFTNRPWESYRTVESDILSGESVTTARFPLDAHANFVRAEIYAGDDTGWSQIFPIPRG